MTLQDDINPATRVWQLINSNWMSQAVYVFAELRLADQLADGPRTSQELAGAIGAHAPSLHRFMRALTTIEICNEFEDGSFGLTPMGALLRSDNTESVRSWALYTGGYQWPIWGHLIDSIKTGKSAREILTGNKEFEHLERDSSIAALFNQAMVEHTRLISRVVVKAFDFSQFKRIADVGGGYGELLAAILQDHPELLGVLFDLPHARETAQQRMTALGLLDRCEFITGSFFELIPSQCDAYLLKSIIHDWNDERSKLILQNCRRAMPVHAKLLLIERIIPDLLRVSEEHQVMVRSDLNMLIGPGGHERTESEFQLLLGETGFHIQRIIPIKFAFSMIEAVPAG
jgi:orsellinic acid C2-O-methyltransferase